MASILKRTYKVTLPDGRTVTRECSIYTIEYTDPATGKRRRHRGFKDKQATQQLAAQLERNAARGAVGLIDPYLPHRGTPLAEHLKDYLADLGTAGRSEKYVENAGNRLRVLFDGCGWSCLGDVDAGSFLRWRERQKKAPRNGTRKPEDPKAKPQAAAETLNQYLESAQAFLNWCAATGRVAGVPVQGRTVCTLLAGVSKAEGPKARKRRALTDDEVGRLLTAAPADRKLVYRVALAIGLRRDELAQLVWGDLQLRATRPYAELRAEATKARRGDRVPIPLTLASDLREQKPDDAKDNDRVFPRVPSLVWWKHDLAAAGIPYLDDMGRQADFHAGTRKTLCTRMHRGNVPLATAMRVMRHTDARLTMVDYADDGQLGGEALPEIPAAVAAPPATVPSTAAAGA